MTAPLLWVGAIVLASLLFGLAAPAVARQAPARTATWLLSTGSLLVAASALVVPSLLVLMAVGQMPVLAGLGRWSAGSLAHAFPGLTLVAVAPGLMLLGQAATLSVWAGTGGRRLIGAWRASRAFDTSLVVIPDTRFVAFALPGWPGRVVASRGLLQSLDGAQRRAVLAHEQAHLDQRHDLHRAAGAVAAAVNPLLGRVPSALRLATERWADETAAAAVGDRARVAETIGRVAIGCSGGHVPPAPAMGAADADVARRVTSLLAGPPSQGRPWQALLLGLAAVAVAVALKGMYDTNQIFQTAERAYLHASMSR